MKFKQWLIESAQERIQDFISQIKKEPFNKDMWGVLGDFLEENNEPEFAKVCHEVYHSPTLNQCSLINVYLSSLNAINFAKKFELKSIFTPKVDIKVIRCLAPYFLHGLKYKYIHVQLHDGNFWVSGEIVDRILNECEFYLRLNTKGNYESFYMTLYGINSEYQITIKANVDKVMGTYNL